jgi:hypothetical protein
MGSYWFRFGNIITEGAVSMMKLATFFFFTFVMCTIIASVVDGGGGIASTKTSAVVSSNATTIAVSTTKNFLGADATHPAYAMIGSKEIFTYTGKTALTFTGVIKGVADPQSGTQVVRAAYGANTTIKTLAVGAMDSFLGYNITTSQATFGAMDAIIFGARMFTNLPKFLMWNYSFLQGEWVMLRYVLMSLSAGFVFSIAMGMLWLAMSIWK